MLQAGKKSKFSITLLVVAAILAAGSWYAYFSWPDGGLHVWFLDVGQGDATLVETPGGKQILIDGGPDQSVLGELSEILPAWDNTIDYIFVTHLHADHLSGVIEVMKHYSVKEVFVNSRDYSSPVVAEFLRVLEEKRIKPSYFYAGAKLDIGGVLLEALWPTQKIEADDINISAMVLKVTYLRSEILLASDVELNDQTDSILRSRLGSVDIIKVPHQGSMGGIDSRMLNLLDPEVAIISVGLDNQYGHPSAEMISLLSASVPQVFRTDQDGTVEVVVSDFGKYRVIKKYI